MHNTMADYTLGFLKRYRSIDENEEVIIHYGASLIYLNLTKIFIVYVVSFILNIFPYILLINIGFSFLRIFAYGVHARTSIGCTLIVLVSFISLYAVAQYTNVPLYVYYGILPCIGLVLIIKYAPGATAKNPIKGKQQYSNLKKKSLSAFLFIYICALCLGFLNPQYGKLLLLGTLLECVTLLPILFRIIEKGEEG